MKISKSLFGMYENREVYRFNLVNAKGNSISIINYGATIISWEVKDKKNLIRNIVAGFDNLDDYIKNDVYMGCIAGRYANRIANGTFSINGHTYSLARNNDINHLHGGNKGLDKVVWDAQTGDNKLSMSYLSMDGEEGYPGNLNIKVGYTYTDEDELEIEYFAETDKATPVNITSHSYFNLTGDVSKNILDHFLKINADQYTPVDMNQIPTGELETVDNTVFDFSTLKKISENLNRTDKGFDHNYVLKTEAGELTEAAILCDPENELSLSVFTTEPGLQFYSGNLLDGSIVNRDSIPVKKHAALCLEAQHFPDSPNHPAFPSTILLPGEKYYSKTVYQVAVERG